LKTSQGNIDTISKRKERKRKRQEGREGGREEEKRKNYLGI
jgi:hypothetical protein